MALWQWWTFTSVPPQYKYKTYPPPGGHHWSSVLAHSYQAGSKHRWYQQAKLYSSLLQLRLRGVTLSICCLLGRLPNPVVEGLLSSLCCVCVCVWDPETGRKGGCRGKGWGGVGGSLVATAWTAALFNIITLICKHTHPSDSSPALIQTDEEGVCSYNLLSSESVKEREIIIISFWCTPAPPPPPPPPLSSSPLPQFFFLLHFHSLKFLPVWPGCSVLMTLLNMTLCGKLME